MAQLIEVDDVSFLESPSWKNAPLEEKQKYCSELERGNILFFPACPFSFPEDDLKFLLAQKQTGAANRKNIAYKPQSDKITNFVQSSPEQKEHLHQVMRSYSQRVVAFLSQLLAPYASTWRLDYASFRPFQEKGRQLRTRARNDLLHTDAFPSRPMHGSRILRFFTNINPTESRFWMTSDPFHDLAKRFGGREVPFPKGITGSLGEKIASLSKKAARGLGLPIILRSPYDSFMLNLHNFVKEQEGFQKNCHKDYWEFPPNCCWIVYTDLVSHAATAGQYALEQTLIIPRKGMVQPELAPLSTLEQLTGQKMINPLFVK
jgi:hypothetical protein